MLDASGSIPVRDYSDAEEMRAAARERHARFFPAKNVVFRPAERKTKITAAIVLPPAPDEPAAPPKPNHMMLLRRLLRMYRAPANYGEVPVKVLKPTSQQVVKAIQAEVARQAGLTVADILSECRAKKVSRARQAAIWLCARETPLSYPHLGRLFGDRDHTTILHSVRRENERRGENLRDAGTAWGKWG